jgi:hypothetical protein
MFFKKNMNTSQFFSRFRVLALVALIISGLAACTPKYLSPGTIASNDLLPQLNTSNVWTVATTQRAGATVTVEAQFWATVPLQSLQVWNAIARTQGGVTTRDTTLATMQPYQAAFSPTKQCDTALITYTVPNLTRSTGQTIQINPLVRVVASSGIFRQRSFLTGNGFTWNP